MEFKQLEAFVAVIKYNSFSEAAKHLYLTQPTVSTHVQSLEKELKSKLIIRTTKKIEVTYRGQQLYECATNILKMRNKIVCDFAEEAPAVVSLAASTIPSVYILPEILGSFQKENSDAVFHMWQANNQKVIDQVLDEKIDLGFTTMTSDHENCVFIPFFKDELKIAAPNTDYYRRLKQERADINRLVKEPFIIRGSDSSTQKEVNALLGDMKMNAANLNVAACMSDIEAIKRAVVNGMGISVLSTLSMHDLVDAGKLIAFPLGEMRRQRDIFMVYNRNRTLKPCVKQLICFIKDFFQQPEPTLELKQDFKL